MIGIEKVLIALGATATAFGAWKMLVVILAAFGLALFYKIHSARQLREGWKRALDEKEKTIQRLSEECRQWKIIFGINELDLSPQKADRIFKRNEFNTPKEAREQLERKPRKRRRRK